MSPGVETGLFAIIGAAVGALGAALAAIVQAVSAGRANRKRMTAEATAAKAAKRRPLYEALIGAARVARVDLTELRHKVNTYGRRYRVESTDTSNFRTSAGHVYACVTAVRIDGSESASAIAQKVQSDILSFLELPRDERYTAAKLTEMIGKLKQAEEDLTLRARKETGG